MISPTIAILPMDGRGQMKRSVWFAMLAGLTMVIGVIVVWWSISDHAQKHVQQMADNAPRLNQLLIRQDIGNRILALERLGQRWTAANDPGLIDFSVRNDPLIMLRTNLLTKVTLNWRTQ